MEGDIDVVGPAVGSLDGEGVGPGDSVGLIGRSKLIGMSKLIGVGIP